MTSSDPQHIAISKSKGITIDWKDGHHSPYALKYLRDHCPCAACTGAHGTEPVKPSSSPLQLYTPTLKILEVQPVGNYAIGIKWSDGHSSGIYSYDHLRSICPCAECAVKQRL
jgi:DUF971 family protein